MAVVRAVVCLSITARAVVCLSIAASIVLRVVICLSIAASILASDIPIGSAVLRRRGSVLRRRGVWGLTDDLVTQYGDIGGW